MKMAVWLALLVVTVTVSGVYVPEDTSDSPVKQVIACPAGCVCASEKQLTAQCYFNYSKYHLPDLFPWQPTRLRIHGDDTAWKREQTHLSVRKVLYQGSNTLGRLVSADEDQDMFDALTGLDISYIPIPMISDDDLEELGNLELLTINYNNISEVHPKAFKMLSKLQILMLDGNQISSLPVDVFNSLENVRELHLRGNRLTALSSDHFTNLKNLEILDLQSNLLTEIESFVTSLNPGLDLNIAGNDLQYISEVAVKTLLQFKAVSVSRNPFWCSCILDPLIEAYKVTSSLFDEGVECFAPPELAHVKFRDLDIDSLPCNGANITAITQDLNLVYQDELVLECNVFGDEPLRTFWITPWGGKYSSKQDSGSLEIVEGLQSEKVFQKSNVILRSKVFVSKNGALHIDKYRGHFSGTYTCVAQNAVGESNSTVSVGITCNIPSVYISSLFISAYCSGAMLGLAVIIGLIRTFVSKCLHADNCNCCCCRCSDVELFEDKIKPEDLTVEVEVCCATTDSNLEDPEFDPDPDLLIPHTPLNSPETSHSSEQCSTPGTEDTVDQAKSQAIWDQLDEVRNRLRCGAERKMEKVRSHVRSITDTGSLKIRYIRDAGSMRIQSIKESGSHAASMVRKNVASGMVQVKYGVQSIKEFCGTGDMGPGTISMVSVTTDVDTKEHKKVIKSHTFV